MTEIVEAAGVVILTRAKPPSVLLLKHSNRWDLPKGHVEPGESLREAALRETEEETGIPAANISLDPDFEYAFEYQVTGKKRGSYNKRVTYFLAFVDHQCDVRLTEHMGYQWMEWPPGLIQTQTIDPLLRVVKAHLSA